MFLKRFDIFVLVLAAIATLATAQTFTASLQGTVTDATGAAAPNARVVLVNEATNVKQEKNTDSRGAYLFTLLPPGSYKMTVELRGFQTAVRSGMVLQVQQQANVDIVLNVGDVATSVEVAGVSPRLDSVSATLGLVVENRIVQSMPLTTRNILDLANLAPGVVGTAGGTGTNFISNGVRNSQSDVLIDGVTAAVHEQGGGATDVKFRPTVELVQEFKLQTNSFSAEFGFTGGAVVNVVTRSGTNQIHGSAFDFLRNSAMNANAFFSNRNGRPIVPSRRNQFGGAVGGPVYLPKIYNGRNRTFFFFHHEGTKSASQATTTQTLPTLLERQGNFTETFDASGRQIQIYNPFNVTRDAAGNPLRAPFPGNVVPSSMFSAPAVAAMKFYPDPNQPGLPFTRTSNFFQSGSSVSNVYQSTAKIDHNFSERSRLSGRLSHGVDTSLPPAYWGKDNFMSSSGPETNRNRTTNAALDYTRTLNPSTVLSVRWGLSRQFGRREFACGSKCAFNPSSFGLTGPWDAFEVPPQFAPEGYQAVGLNRSGLINRGEDVDHLIGSVSKIFGRHTLKFGGEARLYRLNYAQP